MKVFLIFTLITFSQAQDLPNVKLSFYGSSLSDFQDINLSNAATAFSQLSTSFYDQARKNFIFIMGSQPGNSSETRDLVIGAYLNNRRSEFNIIHLDWKSYASGIDLFAIINKLNPVTATANNILVQLKSQGFDISKTYIAGFSFGTVIAGGIGRFFKTNYNIALNRITGLEPPEFFMTLSLTFALNNVVKLSRNDAKFVDVIHTNVDQFGDRTVRGHANFWVNSGVNQPGCSITNRTAASQTFSSWNNFTNTVGCSHGRSYMYYAESVGRALASPAFVSKRCPWWTVIYDPFFCSANSTTSMGFYADVTFTNPQNLLSVNYYLKTKSSSPYSMS